MGCGSSGIALGAEALWLTFPLIFSWLSWLKILVNAPPLLNCTLHEVSEIFLFRSAELTQWLLCASMISAKRFCCGYTDWSSGEFPQLILMVGCKISFFVGMFGKFGLVCLFLSEGSKHIVDSLVMDFGCL